MCSIHIKDASGWPGAQSPAAYFLPQVQVTSGGGVPFRANILGISEMLVRSHCDLALSMWTKSPQSDYVVVNVDE